MNTVGEKLLLNLSEVLPHSKILWEREPHADALGLGGSILTVEMNGKRLTMEFESAEESAADTPDDTLEGTALLDEIVDDFESFFKRSIYRKERFTRIVDR